MLQVANLDPPLTVQFGIIVRIDTPGVHRDAAAGGRVDRNLKTLVAARGVPKARLSLPFPAKGQVVPLNPTFDGVVDRRIR